MISPYLSTENIEAVNCLVEAAGRMALTMREGVHISHKATFDDKVTAADMALSQLITTSLRSRFPLDCIVSEEDSEHLFKNENGSSCAHSRVWMIDPIDGTQNYILDDGQYCVMVGLIVDFKPVFGWVFEPHTGMLYFGGPDSGTFCRKNGGETRPIQMDGAIEVSGRARLLMGSRDRKKHSWVTDLPVVDLVKIGSIGLKVTRILEGKADVFAHLSNKLKTWDTAGPAAIALGAGLEVGGLDFDQLVFPLPEILHDTSIIMGLPGSLQWCRKHLIAPTTYE